MNKDIFIAKINKFIIIIVNKLYLYIAVSISIYQYNLYVWSQYIIILIHQLRPQAPCDGHSGIEFCFQIYVAVSEKNKYQ